MYTTNLLSSSNILLFWTSYPLHLKRSIYNHAGRGGVSDARCLFQHDHSNAGPNANSDNTHKCPMVRKDNHTKKINWKVRSHILIAERPAYLYL
jgi:hypothetical protein